MLNFTDAQAQVYRNLYEMAKMRFDYFVRIGVARRKTLEVCIVKSRSWFACTTFPGSCAALFFRRRICRLCLDCENARGAFIVSLDGNSCEMKDDENDYCVCNFLLVWICTLWDLISVE